MPIRPDPGRPGWSVLAAAGGTPVGRFLRTERDGRPMADLFEPTGPPEAALAAIRAELTGWRIATDAGLGAALVACSGVALDGEDRVTAAIIVNRFPGEPPFGGPWIGLVFRAPDHPGTGRALLARALRLAADGGLPGLGLAVTHGNPAMGLYEDLGFTHILNSMSVEL